MLAITFAVLSAVGFGSGQFMTQLGLRHGRIRAPQALLINLVAANVVLFLALAVAWSRGAADLDGGAVAYFAMAGLLGPFAGRSLNFLAIQRVGATRTAALGMTESLFAVGLGWVVLGQTLGMLTGAGIGVLVIGMGLFINETGKTFAHARRGGSADLADPLDPATRSLQAPDPPGLPGQAPPPASRVAAGVFIGLASGLFFALAGIMRELGLEILPSAVLGASIGSFIALVVVVLNVARSYPLRSLLRVDAGDALPLAVSGVLASAGMVCFLLALRLGGGLAVSTALKNLTPLCTFALSAAFIAHLERVTVRLGLLVALVVAGAVIMTLGR